MNHNQYASLYVRALAVVTDLLLLITLHSLYLYFVAQSNSLQSFLNGMLMYLALIALNPLILYRNIFLTYVFGGSLGKLLTGIKVVSPSGHLLSLRRVVFRQTVGISFSTGAFGVGFLSIKNDPLNEAWHDKLVSSQVIVTNPSSRNIALLIALLLAGITSYLLFTSIRTVITGPIPQELQALYERSQPTEKTLDNTRPIPPLESSPTSSPRPQRLIQGEA